MQLKYIQLNNKLNILKNRKFFVYLLIAIILLGVGISTYIYLAPFGKTISYQFAQKLPGAEEVVTFPPEKGSNLKIPSQIITTSRSRFSVELFTSIGEIQEIKARLKFKKGPREIKLGMRGNEEDNFVYQPLYHSLLQDVNWVSMEEGGIILWQKEKNYLNLHDFIDNPPPEANTASYFVDSDMLSSFEALVSTKEENVKTVVETPLRGNHTILIRVDKEPLILKVSKQDANGYAGPDKYKIAVLKGTTTLAEKKTIADDGITDASRLKTDPQEETVSLGNIKPGIYQVNITYEGTGYDSLITRIEVNQKKLVFKNTILIMGLEPTVFWTNLGKIEIIAVHAGKEQTIKLNDSEDLKIEISGQIYSFNLEDLSSSTDKEMGYLHKLESPKNDIVARGNGYFAFSPNQYFDPEVIRGTNLSNVTSLDEIDYILTSVSKAHQERDWLISEVTFDTDNIKLDENRKLYFSLEVPNLEQYGGELEIESFEIEVKTPGVLSEKLGTKETEEKVGGVSTEKTGIAAVPEKIGSFFSETYLKVKSFFVNSFNKIFRKGEKSDDSKLNSPLSKTTPTPTPSRTPTQTPTPTSAEISKSVKINILNAGAPDGYAKKYADLIKEAGYENVETENAAEEQNLTNAKIQYPLGYEFDAVKIEEILKAEYINVDKVVDIGSTEITVTIGSI